jgi:hypothetical protein
LFSFLLLLLSLVPAIKQPFRGVSNIDQRGRASWSYVNAIIEDVGTYR